MYLVVESCPGTTTALSESVAVVGELVEKRTADLWR
jgi:hypothetical protein